ncbi:MAG: Gfo/Idh/MocA family oxidoreductase [Acetobacteraceae bacterium]|nr:Gfo/Idh/MocA family oxidoreductase [Acetobacteraceae bacterium]
MRIVLIGVSHWHTPFYSEPVLEMTDAAIAGVSDPDPTRAAVLAERAKCPVFADYRDMCATLKPDFAFVLGRHCDMADQARFLIDSRIPFAIEKPCAVNAAEARDIAQRAAAAGVFAAVPLVFRHCPIIETIREIAAGEAIQYLSFKFVGGMVDRYYNQKVEWVIDRATSGGGPLLNLGIHFVDLCRVLLNNAPLTVTGAMMSNRANGLTIEDHGVMLMQGGGASCMVESGYLYPAPNSVFDMHYSIRTEKHYFAARDNGVLEIVTNDRKRTTREMKLTNVFFYPEFVRDTLRRVRDGRPPIADLSDNAAAVALIEAAYAMSPLPV